MKSLRRRYLRHFPPARNRILVNADRSVASLANYKCGFTAMNQCLNDWDKSVHDAGQLVGLDCAIHMIVRDPVRRFQSFVHGWLIDKGPKFQDPHRRGGGNFAYRNLLRVAGGAVHDRTAASALGGDVRAVYDLLINEVDLGAYIRLDAHLHPQAELIRPLGPETMAVTYHNLEIPEAMTRWSRHTGRSLPRANPSSRGHFESPARFRAKVRSLYEDDYERFEHCLNTKKPAGWRALPFFR